MRGSRKKDIEHYAQTFFLYKVDVTVSQTAKQFSRLLQTSMLTADAEKQAAQLLSNY